MNYYPKAPKVPALRSPVSALPPGHGSPVTSPRRERLSCARTAVAHLEEEPGAGGTGGTGGR